MRIRRRKFITLLSGAAAWPGVARAQQRAMPVIGFLSPASPDASAGRLHPFLKGLSEVGYVVGRNVAIEYRWADGQYDRLPALAVELARLRVGVIVAIGDSAALAARAMTSGLPIVFTVGNDPVKRGLVASLNRPGGNITGVTNLNIELGPKRLELLHEIVPAASSIAMLVNPTSPNAASALQELPEAASRLGVKMHVLQASTVTEIDAVFTSFAGLQAGALVISGDNFFNSQSEQLGALSLRYAMPAIFQTREFAAAGGLMSYATSIADQHRIAGAYAGRILKGDKPADLPVQQATKVELIINLQTAKALGLTFPLSLLGRADQVIE
jgi:putative ABC transport system substrate-binding protein